ncbi:MAG: exosortase/archaeosortase family protein, partial [Proteobacteria bacterium]|nr:exosortase/archaeosortase family protein [Pseudomonadota bacterium]
MTMNNFPDDDDEAPEDTPKHQTLLLLLALFGFAPLLTQFFFNLWQFDTYQFFPMALAGAVALFMRATREVEQPLTPGGFLVPLFLIPLALLFLAFASVVWSPWLGALSFLLMTLGVIWGLGGWHFLKAILPSWFVFLTVLPPPLKLDERFALLLQGWAVAGSSRILDALLIPHERTGLVIEIPGMRLLVEEACSGINSILFMTFICVFYAMWMRRSVYFTVFLYIFTIGCVLAGNLVRIVSGAWAYHYYQLEILTGWKHEAIGLCLTAIYITLIILAEKILRNPTRDYSAPDHESSNARASLLHSLKLGAAFKFLTILLVFLGLVQLVRGWDFHFQKDIAQKIINPEHLDGRARFKLPVEVDGWKLVSEPKPLAKTAAYEDGVHSHIWKLQKNGIQAIISLDYPFFGYHDVMVCYRNSGWTVEKSNMQQASAENGFIPNMEVMLANNRGLKAILFYSTVDEQGTWLENSPTRSPYNNEGRRLEEGGVFDRLFSRFRAIPYASESYDMAVNFRIQTLAAAQSGLSSAQKQEVEKLFHKVRPMLAEQFVTASPTPTATPSPTPLDLEPLTTNTPDPTKRAVQEAREATAEATPEDPTKKA